MKRAMTCNHREPKACQDLNRERHDETDSASPINHHHLIRTAGFAFLVREGHLGSALRVQEGHVNS
jgi:hypothetical protein